MTIINAGRWSELEAAAPAPRPKRPAGSEAERTHAADDGRGLSLCGRRGMPLAEPGAAVTCGNCRRRLEAAERRVARRDPPQDSDPMRAAGWKPRTGYSAGEWVPNGNQ